MKTFRHATTRANLDSILEHGLLPDKAVIDETHKSQAVWLHTAARTPWAILHTMKKHKVAMYDVVVLDVQVPNPGSWLTRSKRGLWKCPRVLSPDKITVVGYGETWAESPVTED